MHTGTNKAKQRVLMMNIIDKHIITAVSKKTVLQRAIYTFQFKALI